MGESLVQRAGLPVSKILARVNDPDDTNLLGDCARIYAEAGYAVFPLKSRAKTPITPNGCKDATTDPDVIAKWWKRYPNANIGCATGAASGIIVIDEDVDEEEDKNGYLEMRNYERQHGALPETISTITGRGGYHLFYAYRGSDIGNRTGIIKDVDIRGEGGYVLLPPSIHPNGNRYTWEISCEEMELAEVNDQIRSFLSIGQMQKSSFQLPDSIPEGQRNDTLFRYACSLQAKGHPDAEILGLVESMNSEKCDRPLPQAEVIQIVNSVISAYPKGCTLGTLEYLLDRNGNPTKKPRPTIWNGAKAIASDPDLKGRLYYNELSYSNWIVCPVPWDKSNSVREMDNNDDTQIQCYIENKYNFNNLEKITKSVDVVTHHNQINPFAKALEAAHEKWDGKKGHIAGLLPDMLGADRNSYTENVMQIMMLGAISRTYTPGIKFDSTMVLIGHQGIGKSKFCHSLAIKDEWYVDGLGPLDSDEAIEKLRGKVIIELAELQSIKRTKDIESTKAFISRSCDIYRPKYGRRTERRPRRCILIGTTNSSSFLTDTTGNRRYLPIECGINPITFDMFRSPEATKEEVLQAWGEAMELYQEANGNPLLILPQSLQTEANRMQELYTEDDTDIGVIQDWLDGINDDRVCVLQIWHECFRMDNKPEKRESNHIAEIMKQSITGWKFVGRARTPRYGQQRCYERINKNSETIDIIPF